MTANSVAPSRARFRGPLRLALLAALATLAGLALVLLVGISVDATRWREPAGRALSDLLGREIRIEGTLALVVSLWPEVRVGDVRIANPPQFGAGDLARAQEIRLAADLLPLLQRRIRVRELHAEGFEVELAYGPDGRGNWAVDAAPAPRARSPDDRAFELPDLDLQRISLEDARVSLRDTAGQAHRIGISRLVAEAPRGATTRVSLGGDVDGRLPYSIELVGAPLDALGGDAPWTFSGDARTEGLAVHADGAVRDPFGRAEAEIRFGAGADSVDALLRRLQIETPPLGAAGLVGTLQLSPDRVAARSLNAVLGRSVLAGELAFDATGARPRLEGALKGPALDLLPFLGESDSKAEPETLPETFRRMESRDLDLRRLAGLDAEVEIDVTQILGLPGDVRDVRMQVKNDAGRLVIPHTLMLAGARFAGETTIDASVQPVRLRLAGVARDSPLGGIAEVLFGAPYIDGAFETFSLTLAAEGERLGEIVRSVSIEGALRGARLTYGNFEGGAPVRMTLASAQLAQPRGGSIAATVRGALLDKPFSGRFTAASIERIVRDGGTPFAFDGQASGVRAALSGRLAPTAGAKQGTDIAFRVTADRARDIAPWLGLASASDARVELKGSASVREKERSVSDATLAIGSSVLRGDIVRALVGKRQIVRAAFSSDRIDAAELRQALAGEPTRPTAAFDVPILPREIDLGDSDIDLRLKRVEGLPVRVTDVVFEGHIREGVMQTSPLALRVEDQPLAGAIALDSRSARPRGAIWLAGSDLDLDRILRPLAGLGPNIEASAGHLTVFADIREARLGGALESSALLATIETGRLVVRDANTKAALRVRVESGEVRADPGGPVRARLDGRINRIPVKLDVTTGRLRDFPEPDARVPVTVTAEAADARLTLSGTLAPDVRAPEVALTAALSGPRINSLERLFRTSLPQWGPYAAAANVRVSKRGYEVSDLRVSVGDSVLDGRATFDTSGARPRLDVALNADRIQLDDFPLDKWSPFEAPRGEVPKSMAAAIAESAERATEQVQALFSPELLQAHDADVAVTVKEVVSGKDELGHGRLAARVREGRADIGPVEVAVPGGSATLALGYAPSGETVRTSVRILVDRFDYGVVARRIKPDTDLAGTFSLDVDVRAEAPRLSQSLARGDGRIDLAIWPERLHAGVFDLWATNVLLAMVASVDPARSRVNCAFGQFDLKSGGLESVQMLIDTTNTRAVGSGRVDFGAQRLHFRLAPRPKVPQFFTVATPVEVTGTFEDFDVNVRATDVFETVARWATSLVVVPIQKLATTPPPADGDDVCPDAMRRPAPRKP